VFCVCFLVFVYWWYRICLHLRILELFRQCGIFILFFVLIGIVVNVSVKPTIFRTRCDHANHYSTAAVLLVDIILNTLN
jgi:hypothetical protein